MLATLTASAETDEDSRPLLPPGWDPSIAVTSGFTFQPQEASVDSTIDTTSGIYTAGDPLQKSDSGMSWAVSPYVGVNLEIMTPEVPLPGRVRFFLNGEYLPSFGADLDIAKAGDPKGFVIEDRAVGVPRDTDKAPFGDFFTPPDFNNPCDNVSIPPNRLPAAGQPANPALGIVPANPNVRRQRKLFEAGCNCPYGFGCFPEEAIGGVGSVTTATVGQHVFGAAIGAAVPIEMFGRKMMLKPSFGWIRYGVEAQGAVLRAFKNPFTSTTNPINRPIPLLRTVTLTDTASQAFNAVGPGLELEMEVQQTGPIQASLFMDAHGYRVVGDRTVSFAASTTAACPDAQILTPPDFDPAGFVPFTPQDQADLNLICQGPRQFGPEETGYSARWSFKVDPWLYRVGLGLRFRWNGK